jgi:hypothetical protein
MAGYLGNIPSAVPLTSADIADGIITSAKIVDGTIVNADINASAGILASKLSGVSSKFVAYQYAETFSTSSHSCNNADSDTGLTVSITPSSASNKILVIGQISTALDGGYNGTGLYLKRDSTIIGTPTSGGSGTQFRYHSAFATSYDNVRSGFFFFLDSPSTTSATTYLVGFRGVSGVGTIYMNRSNDNGYRGYSAIMAIELQT